MKPSGAIRLHTIPMTFRQGSAWVAGYHRHNKPPRGCKFVVGAIDNDGLIWGVAMAGRPVARTLDDGLTLEVNRTVTIPDGPPNVNSYLYAACWRIGREMGYLRAVTMTQGTEPGTSLKAAGWTLIGERAPRGSWADSTADERLLAMRDPVGNGGVPRRAWEAVMSPDGRSLHIEVARKASASLREAERAARALPGMPWMYPGHHVISPGPRPRSPAGL